MSRPLFLYVMGNTKYEKACQIGLSREPDERIKQHNRCPLYRPGSKATRFGAPHWYKILIVGPIKPSDAIGFCKAMRSDARKKQNRILNVLHAAEEAGYNCFVSS